MKHGQADFSSGWTSKDLSKDFGGLNEMIREERFAKKRILFSERKDGLITTEKRVSINHSFQERTVMTERRKVVA